jgi:integrase
MRHEYTLFKRYKDAKNKKGIIWFFYYYYEYGNRKAKSTSKSLKHEAVTVVEKFLAQKDSKDRTLNEYAKTFFVWDECLYIKRQLAKGKRFSKTNATLRRDHLTNYILSQFGKRSLSSLNRVEIENWLVSLKSIKTGDQLSNQTKNHILYAFRTILREAEREGIIPYNCLSIVESLAVQPKTRDVFSQAELKKLFPSDLEALTKIWREVEYAYFFFILATTGLRRGECRALK